MAVVSYLALLVSPSSSSSLQLKALSGLTLMAFQVSTTFMQQLWDYKHILFPQKMLPGHEF